MFCNGLKRMVDRFFPVLPVLSAVFFSLAFTWRMLETWLENGTLFFVAGDFYFDRIFSLAMIRTAYEYGINFLDPVSRDVNVFYQFGFYWLVGILGRLIRINPISVLNFLGFLAPGALFAAVYLFGKSMTGSRWKGLAGAWVAFAFAMFESLDPPVERYGKIFGEHAVVMPFSLQLSAPYIDTFGLIFSFFGFYFLHSGIHGKQERKEWRLWAFVICGFFALLTHLLQGILFLLVSFAILFSETALDRAGKKPWPWVTGGVLIIYVVSLIYFEQHLPMAFLAAFGATAFSALLFFSNKRKWVAALAGAIGLVGMVFLLNYLKVSGGEGSFGAYNADIRMKELSIPAGVLLYHFFPVLALGLASLLSSSRRAIYGGLLLVTFAAVFNDQLGYNNHPYRFITYSAPIWAILAVEGWAVLDQRLRRWKVARPLLAFFFAAALAPGVVYGIQWFSRFGTMIDPINPLMPRVAKVIDTVRATKPETVVAVDEELDHIRMDLAALSGARFDQDSFLSFRGKSPFQADLIGLPTLKELWRAADQAGRGRYGLLVTRQAVVREQALTTGRRGSLPASPLHIYGREENAAVGGIRVYARLWERYQEADRKNIHGPVNPRDVAKGKLVTLARDSGPAGLAWKQVSIPHGAALVFSPDVTGEGQLFPTRFLVKVDGKVIAESLVLSEGQGLEVIPLKSWEGQTIHLEFEILKEMGGSNGAVPAVVRPQIIAPGA